MDSRDCAFEANQGAPAGAGAGKPASTGTLEPSEQPDAAHKSLARTTDHAEQAKPNGPPAKLDLLVPGSADADSHLERRCLCGKHIYGHCSRPANLQDQWHCGREARPARPARQAHPSRQALLPTCNGLPHTWLNSMSVQAGHQQSSTSASLQRSRIAWTRAAPALAAPTLH